MEDILPHHVQDRLCPRKCRLRAPTHEGQRAGRRAGYATGNWRINHFEAPFLRLNNRIPRGCDIDGGTVNQQRTVLDNIHDLVIFEINRTDMLPGWQHGNHDLHTRGSVGTAGRSTRAGIRSAFHSLRRNIERAHFVSGADQIGHHRPAHIPQPDKSDL